MDNRKDLDTSLSGLTQEKMQKVSAFRVTANVTLAKSSLPAMTVGQAVKYLYASKFDVKKAEEIFHRYQELHKEFSLSDLTLNKHSLNTEIRSKKLEILGARDNDGAQILLFTVKKHKGGGVGGGGGVSPENKTAVQLLFLLLDQISESNGTMNKGVTLLVDLQECSQSSCDMKYVTTILNVLHGGYPLYLNMVYILEAPSWFKLSREPVYQSLTKAGKVKMLSLIDLSSVISPSSLPSSLKSPLNPHSPPSSSSASSSSPNHVTSRNKSPPKSNPPVAPPPRMDKPMKKQSSEPTIPLQGEELDAMSSVSVSKIMEVFQGQVPTSPPPPPHAVKSQALSRGGKLPQANGMGGAQNHHGNQKNSKLFGGSSGPPLQPFKTSSAPPQYEVVGGGSPPSSSPVRKVSPPSKYPPLFPPPSSVPPPSYSPPPPPPSSKPTKPSVSQRPHWLHKSPKVSDTEATPTQTSYSAEDVGNVHEEEGEGTGGGAAVPPKSRDDSDISTTSSGASSSNKQKSSPSVSKRLRLGEAGNKIAQVFKGKKGAESDKKQATPSQDEDAPGSDAVGDCASKKLEKIGKSLVPVRIFGHKKENDKEQSDSVKSNGHASNHAPSTAPKGTRSHLMQYNNVSVKPTRPLEKIVTDRDPSHTSATPTQPYMVTKIREKLPMSPPAAWTPPEYAAIRKPIKPDHASPRRSLTPPPSLPPQYSEDALLDDEDDDDGVGVASPHQHKRVDKRNAYENICFTVDEDEGEILSSESAKTDEIIYENYGPDKGNRWMTTSELEQYITEKGNKGLSEEYLKIKNEPVTGSADYFRLPCNSNKNRYKDVICYDSTRVTLSSIPDVEGSDYIHANYCNGYQKPQAVILTQGPLKRTVNDYWRMLWEKEVFVIVMATKCIEMRKLKCAQYWPDGTTSTVSQFGDITVTVVNDISEGTYQFRQFVAIKNGETRNLMHYQFLGWPDYGVPENGSDVIDVLYAARTMQESYRDYVTNPDRFPVHGPPMVIHCSAGIGRSGTFASLDYCIDELRMTNKVNVQQCVRLLRQQRAFSIQTDEQYAFCYKTVLQYALYLKAALER